MILYGLLVLSFLNIVNSLINYSQLMNEQSKYSAVDLYQLRTNTIIDIKTLAQRVGGVDSFGRERDDPYYEGVKRFQDYEHPSDGNYQVLTIEKSLEQMFGEHFFEDKKYLLFIIFAIIILLLLISCASLCCCWMCKTRRNNPVRLSQTSQTLSKTNTIYQNPFIPERSSFLPKYPVYFDLEHGPPDYSSL